MLPSNTRPLARLVLLSLLLTFIAARVVSILMTLHRVPDIYLHVSDTHVHHLNYGIFLLAGVGAYLLFSPGPTVPAAALMYGIGLGLTFDEFGMWLHLNGEYWQRASFDAIIVLAAALALAGFAPPLRAGGHAKSRRRCCSFCCSPVPFGSPHECSRVSSKWSCASVHEQCG